MLLNKIIECKVMNIQKTFIGVECNENNDILKGFIHISEISDYYVPNIKNIFQINNKYWFKVIEYNIKEKIFKLSWKNLKPRYLKNPFEFVIKETEKGFKNLLEKTKEELKND